MINESPLSVKTAYTFDSNYFNSENKIFSFWLLFNEIIKEV